MYSPLECLKLYKISRLIIYPNDSHIIILITYLQLRISKICLNIALNGETAFTIIKTNILTTTWFTLKLLKVGCIKLRHQTNSEYKNTFFNAQSKLKIANTQYELQIYWLTIHVLITYNVIHNADCQINKKNNKDQMPTFIQ